MADSALFQSYRESEQARLRDRLKGALSQVDAEDAAQHAATGGETFGPPSPQPGQLPAPEGRSFLQGAADAILPPDRSEREQPGVLGSLRRGIAAVPERALTGGQEIADVLLPAAPKPAAEGIVGHHVDALSDVGRVAMGALQVALPFSAFIKETGGDALAWVAKSIGTMSDQQLDAAIAAAPSTPDGPQLATELKRLRALPEAERYAEVRELWGNVSEALVGTVPGYTAIGKLARRVGGAAAPAPAAAPAARGGMLALNPAPEAGITRQGDTFVAPGPVRQPGGVEGAARAYIKPAERQTRTELVQRALEARREGEREAAERLGAPGADRLEQTPPREILRREGRTPLDAEPSPTGQSIAKRTMADGGATFSPTSGQFHEDTGYGVSVFPERGRVITGREPSAEDMASFLRENEDLLQDPRAHLGTWRDENGRTHLDISIVTGDKGEALGMGRQYRQMAVYDFAGKNSIDVPTASGPHPYTKAAEPLTDQDVAAARMYDSAVTDPASKPAWDALAREVDKDFEEISKTLKIERVTGQPYASAEEMSEDIRRGVMKVTTDNSEHPFWDVDTNFKFRAVHDYRGHFETGNDFSLGGEFKAWRAHDEKILDPAAKEALQVEVYGQAAAAQANGGVFPEQKTFLPSEQPGGGIQLPAAKDRLAGVARGEGGDASRLAAGRDEARAALDQTRHTDAFLAVERAGAQFLKLDDPLGDGNVMAWFHDPVTGSTGLHAVADMENFGQTLAASRAEFRGAEGTRVVGKADEARARLKETWQQFKDLLGDERGALQPRGEIGPKLSRHTFNDLVTVGAEAMWFGARTFRDWSAKMLTEYGPALRPHLKALYDDARKKMAAFKSAGIADVKQVVKLFHDGEFGANWYDKAADELKAIFGYNADLYADVLAATSPHNSVKGNVEMTNQAMAAILSGERSRENLFKAGEFMDAHRGNLNRILLGQPLSGPKVGAFARAIKGDTQAVVVDTWMLRGFGFPEMPSGHIDPSEARVLFIDHAVTDIAKQYGVDPRQAQAAIWVGKKIADEGPETFIAPLHEVVRAKLAEDDTLLRMTDPATSADEKLPDWVNESGKVQAGVLIVLGRAAAGAVVGGAMGENPEDRAYLALLGAGVGSVLSARFAERVAHVLKNEAGAINPKVIRAERKAAREAAREPMPNIEYMGTGEKAKGLVSDIATRLSKEQKLLRDSVVSHDETILKAKSSRYNKIENILTLDDNSVLNRSDIYAARNTRDAMLEDWLKLAARAEESGDLALRQKAAQQYLLTAQVVRRTTNVSTEIAGATEAHKIATQPARAGVLDYDVLAKSMDQYAVDLANMDVTADNVLQIVRDIKDPKRIKTLMDESVKEPSAWWKIYYGLNLFSHPLYHVRNVVGNSSALMMSIATRAAGEVIGSPFTLAGVKTIRGKALVAPGETKDLLLGLVDNLKDAWAAGKQTNATGASQFKSSKYNHRLNVLESQKALMEEKGGAFKLFFDATVRLAERNLRFGAGTDEFFKVLGYSGEKKALARRQAWSEAARGDSWKDILATQARLYEEPTQAIVRGANDFADTNTFTKAFEHDPSRPWYSGGNFMAQAENLASNGLMRVGLTPVFHVPMRIAEFGLDYTPGLNAVSLALKGDLLKGGATSQLAAGKIALAGGMTAVLGSYAAAGYITGDWARDPGLRRAQEEAGFKPFAFFNPLNDKYYSYSGFGPFVAPLAAIATYAQMAPHLKDQGLITVATAVTLAMLKTNLAQPYFDGLRDVVDIFDAYDDEGAIKAAMQFVADRAKALVPLSGALRTEARAMDPQKKDWKEFGAQFDPAWGDAFAVLGRMMQDIPGLSKMVPAYRNIITGEPIPYEGGPFPGLVSKATGDPVLREVLELGGAGLPRELPRVIGGRKAPLGVFRVTAPPEGTVAPLTHAQRTRLADLMTKGVKIDGLTLHAALTELIASDEYKEQSDGKAGGKAYEISSLWHAYLEMAEDQLIDEDKNLQESLRTAGIERELTKVPTAQQPQIRRDLLGR